MSDLTNADLEAMEKRTWSDNLIWEAVARGWCANENAHKEMDVTLGEAIAVEVQTLIREHFYKLPALIARVGELEAAIREHCEACALSIECGRCSLDSPAYCAIRPFRGGE